MIPLPSQQSVELPSEAMALWSLLQSPKYEGVDRDAVLDQLIHTATSGDPFGSLEGLLDWMVNGDGIMTSWMVEVVLENGDIVTMPLFSQNEKDFLRSTLHAAYMSLIGIVPMVGLAGSTCSFKVNHGRLLIAYHPTTPVNTGAPHMAQMEYRHMPDQSVYPRYLVMYCRNELEFIRRTLESIQWVMPPSWLTTLAYSAFNAVAFHDEELPGPLPDGSFDTATINHLIGGLITMEFSALPCMTTPGLTEPMKELIVQACTMFACAMFYRMLNDRMITVDPMSRSLFVNWMITSISADSITFTYLET